MYSQPLASHAFGGVVAASREGDDTLSNHQTMRQQPASSAYDGGHLNFMHAATTNTANLMMGGLAMNLHSPSKPRQGPHSTVNYFNNSKAYNQPKVGGLAASDLDGVS